MLRLCICLIAVWLVGCQCPVPEEKQAVKEEAPDSRPAAELSPSVPADEAPLQPSAFSLQPSSNTGTAVASDSKRRDAASAASNTGIEEAVSRMPAVLPPAQQKPAELADIQWVTSFAEGLKTAKSRNCPMMVDFFAHWCGWCVKLDEETWTNRDVILLSQRFVCVKIDCDQDRQTPARYGARGLPTTLFITPDEKVIHQVVGYRKAEDMIAEMNKAL